MNSAKKFILWDGKDGRPQEDENGMISSAGLIGVIEEDNIYLTSYANYGGAPRHSTLRVCEWTEAEFNLSGSRGTYRIYRVA